MRVMLMSLLVLHCGVECAAVEPRDDNKASRDIAFPDDLSISRFTKQDHVHPYHLHSPEFHHHHHFSSDHHVWEEEPEDHYKRNFADSNMQIPLEFIQDINEYNVSDLLIHFVEGAEDRDIIIEDRFNDDEVQEKSVASAIMAKDARCMPELQTVKIAPSDDPNVLYIPQCTRIERCGGCCQHNLLSCQATEKETVKYKVFKTKYTGEKKLKFLGSEEILVEKHNKCKCDCRLKKEDCSTFQEYRKAECQCVCTNNDERKKCAKSNETKLWNPDLCMCQCRESIQCSTGSYFDQNECRCLPVPMRRRFANFYRKRDGFGQSASDEGQ